jgi:hypothetical protein
MVFPASEMLLRQDLWCWSGLGEGQETRHCLGTKVEGSGCRPYAETMRVCRLNKKVSVLSASTLSLLQQRHRRTTFLRPFPSYTEESAR